VLATNVVALLHHLMEGTYVPFAINSFMDLVVFLMGMMQLLPFAIDAFPALVQLKNLLFQPLHQTLVVQQPLCNNLPSFPLRMLMPRKLLGKILFLGTGCPLNLVKAVKCQMVKSVVMIYGIDAMSFGTEQLRVICASLKLTGYCSKLKAELL
jgi:hypothetical protein